MKREMLRINNLNYSHAPARKLENISLCIMEGESVGFLGLTYSGKNLLVSILKNEIRIDPEEYSIYIAGMRIRECETLEDKVYRICADNYRIGDWSVAEYIGLVDTGWFRTIRGKKELEEGVRALLAELCLDFDASEKIRDLTELEKRIVDLAKACWRKAGIVIVEDEMAGMNQAEVTRFGQVMHRVIAGRMAAIISSHSNMVLSVLADKYVIFDKGHIVKKCRATVLQGGTSLEDFLQSDTPPETGDIIKSMPGKGTREPEVIFQVRGMQFLNGKKEDFSFAKGQITVLLVRSLQEKERMFLTLSGRGGTEATFILNSRRCENTEIALFVKEKVVSVAYPGSSREIFPYMTVEENLLLPSMEKISSMDYIRKRKNISRVLAEEIKLSGQMRQTAAQGLEVNDRIRITMERWYIYNPRVLILLEPFAMCDMYGVAIVREYICKFAEIGTTVIVLSTREEYLEDIADNILRID